MPAASSTKINSPYQGVTEEPEAVQSARSRASRNNRPTLSDPENSAAQSAPIAIGLARTWLAWQCRMVAGIIRGTIYLPADDKHIGSTISTWPGEGEGESQLIEAATRALQQGRGLIRSQQRYGPGNRRTCDLIACPLVVDNTPVAVVAVMVSTRSEPQQQAVLQLLQWGGLWMETLVRQQLAARREAGAFSLNLVAAVLGSSASQTAAMETVNRLSDHSGCERVSMGFRRGLSIRLRALSHMASFDPRTQLVRRIEAAMEEALDRNISMIYPADPDQEPAIIRAHAELVEQQGVGAVCTVPVPGRSKAVGAITLERGADRPFNRETVDWFESLARLIGPALELKQREERSLWSKGIEALRELAARLFGPTRLRLKAVVLSAAALLTALSFIDGTHKVTAPASIEGAVRQILVAPQEGYVKEAELRAGDLVEKGQVIASLDDRKLQLEAQKWLSERNKIEKEYQEALAKRDRTQLSVLRAKIDQVDAELRLVEERIERTRLRSPFDGVLVSGDLSQSLGAPVETGQVLFEVAPLESYRVVLEVDEHDMSGLDSGRPGQLVIAALPQKSFGISVDRVVPVAVSGEVSNYFRVEATLDEPSSLLRPGMRGVGKVEMGERSILWIWTHAVFDRIRLWAWSAGL